MLNKLQHILLGIVVLALVRVFMLAVPGSIEENHEHALIKKACDAELCNLSAITDNEEDDEPGRKKIKTGFTELPVAFSYRPMFVIGNPGYASKLTNTNFTIDHLNSYLCCWRI